jgi:hypothetical protein
MTVGDPSVASPRGRIAAAHTSAAAHRWVCRTRTSGTSSALASARSRVRIVGRRQVASTTPTSSHARSSGRSQAPEPIT